MAQASFAHSLPVNDPAGVPMALSIFADRLDLREEMRVDAELAGFRIAEATGLARLLEGEAMGLGGVVLVDCPKVDGVTLAALVRLDLRAAHCGAQLVVSTSVAALDDVFGCLDQSGPQILVDPTRAERVIALGRVLGQIPDLRLRELTEDDRLTLLRLTEQVGQIAQRLERIGLRAGTPPQSDSESEGVFRFESPRPAYLGAPEQSGDRLVRQTRAPLPEPRLVRRIILSRQRRASFFDGELFADPAWDMLLDLTAARVEHKRVSVSSLCIAAMVPPTTALRWIGQMTEAGLFVRIEDDTDRRRAFIALSDKAADAMARYFAALDSDALRLV